MIEINDQIIHFHQINKKWHWRIKSKHGDLISRSDRGFDLKDHCEQDARNTLNI